MKKKLTAALLTLCMVISLLPLSALAASWTAKLGGEAVTVTEDENGEITVTRDSDKQDLSQYYTFEKVTQGTVDTFKYYSLDGVHTGTLTDVVAVEEAAGETTVEGDTATTEVTIEEGTVPSIAPEIDDEDLSGLVGNETVSLEVSLKDAGGNAVDNVAKVTYEVPNNLITEAVKDTTAAKEVAISLPVSGFKVTLPVTVIKDDLKSQVKLTITASSNGIDIKLENGELKDAKEPVSVEFTAPQNTAAATHTVAYKNGNVFERLRSGFNAGKAWFKTRHFSEFVVVEKGTAVPAALDVKQAGTAYTFSYESDEGVIYTLKDSDGTYTYTFDKSNAPGGALNEKTIDSSKGVGSIYTVFGEMPNKGADGTVDSTANVYNSWAANSADSE